MDHLQAARLLLLLHQLELQENIIQLLQFEVQLMELEIDLNELEQPAKRSKWVKFWVTQREHLQPHISLFRDLQVDDLSDFRSFISMNYATFQELVRRVGPRIQKKHTHYRKPISVLERLLLTGARNCQVHHTTQCPK